MIATDDFRRVIEQIAEYETNPISRFRVKRALRNDRVLFRWRLRVEQYMKDIEPVLYASLSEPVSFDFQSLLDWLMENWDEILKILLTIIPLFI